MARDTGPAKLPSLPPLPRDVDPALRRFLQALGERSEVREGSRGNDAERVVLQRDLKALASSSQEARGWLAKYGSIDALAQAIKSTPTFAEVNVATPQVNLPADAPSTGGSAPPPAPSGVVTPPDLALTRNDLDFWLSQAVPVPSTKSILRLRVTVDLRSFFSAGADHFVMAINCEDQQGRGNPNYGPIVRNGRNLYGLARGFFLRYNGAVIAEHWNNTASPGMAPVGTLSPSIGPVTVTVTAGYRTGPMANTMAITIERLVDGVVLLNTSVPWGWDYRSTCEAGLGAIGAGFIGVGPGQSETWASGIAPNARVQPAGFRFEAL